MADIDWAFAAVIIALLAYPLQALAIPVFQHWATRHLQNLARFVWPFNKDCPSLELQHLPAGAFHQPDSFLNKCGSLCTAESFQKSLSSRRWSDNLELFFPSAWDMKRMVRKPPILPSTKKYIRVDVEVLLVYAHLVMTIEQINHINTKPTEWFEEIIELVQCGAVIIARRRPTILSRLRLRYFDELHSYLSHISGSEMNSYFYNKICPKELRLLNGCKISHPHIRPGAYRRGGWVIALGMSHNCRIWPDRHPSRLLPFVLRGQLVKNPFIRTDSWLTPDIASALLRVKDTIELRLLTAYPNSAEVNSAVNLLQKLYEDYSRFKHYGSGSPLGYQELFKSTANRAMSTDYMKSCNAELCAKIVEMFDSHEGLTEEEKILFKDELLNICRCAIKGMVMVIEYHSEDTHFVEPVLLSGHTHVFLEEDIAVE
jgi:hypothetical protein